MPNVCFLYFRSYYLFQEGRPFDSFQCIFGGLRCFRVDAACFMKPEDRPVGGRVKWGRGVCETPVSHLTGVKRWSRPQDRLGWKSH